LLNVTGDCLTDVLSILDTTTPGIETMADLLNPAKLFPTSFSSLTLPTPDGPVLIYDEIGAVNSVIVPILNSGSVSPTGCDELAKIVPQANAAASRALQIAFQQVKGITGVTTRTFLDQQPVSLTMTILPQLHQPLPHNLPLAH
jgi:hypothetical protein